MIALDSLFYFLVLPALAGAAISLARMGWKKWRAQ